MKAKERARLLSGAAAILLCIKLVIVAHGSLRIGAASLLQRQDEGARVQQGDPLASSKRSGIQSGSSTLSSCCHSQCNGLKDSVRFCARLAPGGRKLKPRGGGGGGGGGGHPLGENTPAPSTTQFLDPEGAMRESIGTLLIILP